jgi:hypothetical protein
VPARRDDQRNAPLHLNEQVGFALISCEAVQRSTGIHPTQIEKGATAVGRRLIMRLVGSAA